MAEKIVLKEGVFYAKIHKELRKFASDLDLTGIEEGTIISIEDSKCVENEWVVTSFKIGDKIYSSQTKGKDLNQSVIEPKKEQPEEKNMPVLKTGKLVMENNTYFFQPSQGNRTHINWLEYPNCFAPNEQVMAELLENVIVKIVHKNNSYMNPLPKSPYNFVPLNDKVVYPANQNVSFEKYEGNTGYIGLNITNKTPLFIRGDKTDFLQINGKTILAGSSLRGMVRNVIEIVSFGKFVTFHDRLLYSRIVGRTAARDRQIGFLIYDKSTNTFKIYAAENTAQALNDPRGGEFEYKFVEENDSTYVKIYSGKISANGNFKVKYTHANNFHEVPENIIKSYLEDDSRGAEKSMKDLVDTAKKEKIKINPTFLALKPTYIGVPVWYQLGKDEDNKDKVIHFGHCKNYRVPAKTPISDDGHIPKLLQDKSKIDFAEIIFGTVDNKDKLIASRVFFEDAICEKPTFFPESVLKILGSPKPTSYQLYLTQKGVHVSPLNLIKWESAKAEIRGYKQYWHRLTSEKVGIKESYNTDYFSVNKESFKVYLEKVQKINNPTSYIANLIQNQWAKPNLENRDKLDIIGNIDNIRDVYKKQVIKDFFFLDDTFSKEKKITLPQNTLIKALKQNENTFTGRIRFENLSDEELGALIFALDLPPSCCHKIGMGKSLGLGTIKVEITNLHLSDRKNRYAKLIEDDSKKGGVGNWLQPTIDTNIPDFKAIFEKCIKDDLKKQGLNITNSLWETERLKQFKAMLEFDKDFHASPEWLEKTRYMTIRPTNEFVKRNVLPKPTDIKPQ